MDIESAREGRGLRVKPLDSRLDSRAGSELRHRVAALLGDGDHVLLDLSAVDFVDSSGLGAIVSILKLIGSGGDLTITGVGPRVGETLRLTHLDRVLRVLPGEPLPALHS